MIASLRSLKEKYGSSSLQAKATIWFLVCSVMQKGISVITTPIFTRIMSTTEYGQYSVFDSWMGIIGAIVILTLPYGVTEQGLIKYSDRRNSLLSSIVGLMTTLCFGWGIVYYFVGRSFFNSLFTLTTIQMVCMFVMLWATSVFNSWAVLQRVEYKYKRLVLVTIITSIAKPLVSIVFILKSNDKATARILALTIVEFVVYIWLFISILKNGKAFYHKDNWKYALVFNIPLIPHYLSQRVLNSSDRIMIQRMVGFDSAGIYNLAYSVSMLFLLLNTATLNAIGPWMFQNIKEKQFHKLKTIVYPSMILIGVANIILVCFAPEIVRLFAPEKYYDAIWIIPPVAISGYFQYLYAVFVNFEFYYEKRHFISTATIVGALLNVALNYLFIPIFGYYAAGYTTLVCYIAYAVGHYIFMNAICKTEKGAEKPFNTSFLLGISSLLVGISLAISLTYKKPIVRYGIVTVSFVLLYFFRDRVNAYIRMIRQR